SWLTTWTVATQTRPSGLRLMAFSTRSTFQRRTLKNCGTYSRRTWLREPGLAVAASSLAGARRGDAAARLPTVSRTGQYVSGRRRRARRPPTAGVSRRRLSTSTTPGPGAEAAPSNEQREGTGYWAPEPRTWCPLTFGV